MYVHVHVHVCMYGPLSLTSVSQGLIQDYRLPGSYGGEKLNMFSST